jgi:hypothetical protein
MRTALFFGLLLSLSTASLAQESDAQPYRGAESMQAGSFALQFGVQNNFNLSSFSGALVSGKYHFGERIALRFGVSASAGQVDESSQSQFEDDPGVFSQFRTTERSSDDLRMSLEAPLVFYPAPEAPVKPFLGFGPTLFLAHSESNYVQTDRTERDDLGQIELRVQEEVDDRRTWGAGAVGVVGAEWFATRAISFSAEYLTTFRYERTTAEETEIDAFTRTTTNGEDARVDTREAEEDTDAWSWSSGGVRVGLTLYL